MLALLFPDHNPKIPIDRATGRGKQRGEEMLREKHLERRKIGGKDIQLGRHLDSVFLWLLEGVEVKRRKGMLKKEDESGGVEIWDKA